MDACGANGNVGCVKFGFSNCRYFLDAPELLYVGISGIFL